MKQMVRNWRELETLGKSVVKNKETNTIELGTNLEVDGTIKDLSKIVDTNGNPRFVEGNITTFDAEGLVYNYSKWSLSGTHLSFVVSFSASNGTTITNGQKFGEVILPSYILDKIVVLWGTENVINITFQLYAEDWSTQGMTVVLRKSNGKIIISRSGGNLTLTANRNVRIQFDLLIDTD